MSTDYLISFVLEIVFAASWYLFALWFVLLGGAFLSRRNFLQAAESVFLLLVVARFVLVFNPHPYSFVVIPEPLNTALFGAAGLLLFAFGMVSRLRRPGIWHKSIDEVRTMKDLLSLPTPALETLIVELYHRAGHEASLTRMSGNKGVDIVVRARNGEMWVVQCKCWRGTVGEAAVREFYEVIERENADKGTLITTGTFSQAALEWVADKQITLYDGKRLLETWKRLVADQSRRGEFYMLADASHR